MGAALPFSEPPSPDESSPQKPHQILRFPLHMEPSEKNPTPAELELQAEVRALREELHQTLRQLAQAESLLRNARLREQELRAELLGRK